jgi:uncharacterized linocin/CFP29 family protein
MLSFLQDVLSPGFDPGLKRPFVHTDGRTYYSVRDPRGSLDTNGKPKMITRLASNVTGALLRDEWIQIDRAVQMAAQPRLRAWADLRGANTFTIPSGWGKTVLESARAGDITGAEINMDGIAVADQDRIHQDLVGVPLPIIHKDFDLSARQLDVSRQGSLPLDTTLGELAARKVAEEVEKLTIGVDSLSYTFGGYTLYGYRTFPDRLAASVADPTAPGWTPAQFITDVINMRKASQDAGYYGPWRMYLGSDWDVFLDADYSTAKGDNTLRQRVLALDGISSIGTLDFIPSGSYDVLLVQQTPDVARAVVGMELVTMQYAEMGGMRVRMKVMAIMVPQLRSDFYGGTGLVHGSVT